MEQNCKCTRDEPRWRRSVEVVTSGIIEKAHDIILNNQRVKLREIFEVIGISHGMAITILHGKLSMKKLSARWVPGLFIAENTQPCGRFDGWFSAFRRNPSEFLRQQITVNETWTKRTSPEESKIGRQGDANAFFGCEPNHLHYLLNKRISINGDYCTD